ncbi:MAG: biopolymer transporter ExbD [Leptolyngbyaceae cyanobacterium RM1_406_9]|nr:biopolymer transporter ExbD [Leptolyngbyaceae cyanobacterium RM1_406_9]
MRFKDRHQTSQLPEIELTPMLNVMMGILAFFVMITMSLTAQQSVDIQLPNSAESASQTASPELLVVKLTQQGQILLNDQPATRSQLAPQMQQYLGSNQEGFVILTADRQIPYEQVVQLLGEMREIGGDRVSLAID